MLAFSTAGPGRRLRLTTPGPSPPLTAASDSSIAFLDGEVYNPASGGDPAGVVLERYLQRGASALSELRGRFALVIWDGRREELLCLRDPMGTHPLFYAQREEGLALSICADALVHEPGVPGGVDRLALACRLANRWPDAEWTCHEAVRRVPPGCVLRVGRSGRRLHRHWDPVPGNGRDWVREDAPERFETLFAQAVQRCMDGRRAGVLLSGGLDSVSIAAMAADLAGEPGMARPWALSLGFPHPDCNEERVQRGVAARLGLPQVLVGFDRAVGRRGLLLEALQMSAELPAPLFNFWLAAYRHLGTEGRRRGCDVLLTGEGGDEWLSVAPVLAADLLRRGDFASLWRLWRSQQRSYRLPFLPGLRSTVWTYGLRPLIAGAARACLEPVAPGVLRARWRRRIVRTLPAWIAPDPDLRAEVEARAQDEIARPRPSDHYLAELRTALDHPLVALELEEAFEHGRRLGVAVRQPFLDADLVELLCRTPPEVLNRGGRAKGLVRGTLARRFPGLGFEQQKKVGATRFAQDTLLAEGRRAWRSLGSAWALAELGVVDARRLEDEVTRTLADPGRRAQVCSLWDLFSAEAWVRTRL